MKRYEIIPSRHWLNSVTGQTASIYGSSPYVTEQDKENWNIVSNGFTIRDNKMGEVGRCCGGKKFPTCEEAQDFIESHLNNIDL